MNFFDGLVINFFPIPPLILEIGFIILAFALFRFARVLGDLLRIIQRPPLEAMVVVAGVVLILTFVIPHYIVSAVFYPNLATDSSMFGWLGLFRTISFIGMLIAAVLVTVPSALYLWWTSR